MHDDSQNPEPESAEWLRYCGPNWYGEQDENGIDLSLIRENLRLTPVERIRRGERLADQARRMTEHVLGQVGPFEELVHALNSNGVEFALVGGWGELLHGSARAIASDVDLCYRRTHGNQERLAEALVPLEPRLRGAPADVRFALNARTLETGCNFTLKTSLGALDLLGHIEPIGGYDELARRAETFDLNGVRFYFASLDDLIRVRRRLNRPKDRVALVHLLAIRRIRDEQGRHH